MQAIARHRIVRERNGRTLQATALVHETFERLIDVDISWQNRKHFYLLCSREMRRILIDHARHRNRLKRSPQEIHVEAFESETEQNLDWIHVDALLNKLNELDEQKSQLFDLHYFGGFGQQEVSDLTKVPLRTVQRELQMAKAWIMTEINNSL